MGKGRKWEGAKCQMGLRGMWLGFFFWTAYASFLFVELIKKKKTPKKIKK